MRGSTINRQSIILHQIEEWSIDKVLSTQYGGEVGLNTCLLF